MEELKRIEQDRSRFNKICSSIGFNNAVEGENNSIQTEHNQIELCRALTMQKHKPSYQEQQFNSLMQGNKIILGGY